MVGMLFQEFPMVPLGQRIPPQCIGHLVLWEDTSWRDPCAALDGLAPHSHSTRQGGLGARGNQRPWAQPSPIAYFPIALWPRLWLLSEARTPAQLGVREGPPRSQGQYGGGGGAGPLQTWPSSSDPRGLLDAVKADTGWGGGDGHGAGHPGADRVLVLPSVPPLPDGRADLWA